MVRVFNFSLIFLIALSSCFEENTITSEKDSEILLATVDTSLIGDWYCVYEKVDESVLGNTEYYYPGVGFLKVRSDRTCFIYNGFNEGMAVFPDTCLNTRDGLRTNSSSDYFALNPSMINDSLRITFDYRTFVFAKREKKCNQEVDLVEVKKFLTSSDSVQLLSEKMPPVWLSFNQDGLFEIHPESFEIERDYSIVVYDSTYFLHLGVPFNHTYLIESLLNDSLEVQLLNYQSMDFTITR